MLMAAGVAPRLERPRRRPRLDGGAVATGADMRTSDPAASWPWAMWPSRTTPAAGRPLRVEHWGEALDARRRGGRGAGRSGPPGDNAPGFWSTIAGGRSSTWPGATATPASASTPATTGLHRLVRRRRGVCVGVLCHERDDDYERGRELVGAGDLRRERPLRCCVVVPARDEQDLIGACLDALAAQRGCPPAPGRSSWSWTRAPTTPPARWRARARHPRWRSRAPRPGPRCRAGAPRGHGRRRRPAAVRWPDRLHGRRLRGP